MMGEWTTEPPTISGWYWAKRRNGNIALECVEVYGDKEGMYVYAACHDAPLDTFLYWYGPIPEPDHPEGSDG